MLSSYHALIESTLLTRQASLLALVGNVARPPLQLPLKPLEFPQLQHRPSPIPPSELLASVAVAHFGKMLAELAPTKDSIRSAAEYVKQQTIAGCGKRLIQKLVEFVSKVSKASSCPPCMAHVSDKDGVVSYLK